MHFDTLNSHLDPLSAASANVFLKFVLAMAVLAFSGGTYVRTPVQVDQNTSVSGIWVDVWTDTWSDGWSAKVPSATGIWRASRPSVWLDVWPAETASICIYFVRCLVCPSRIFIFRFSPDKREIESTSHPKITCRNFTKLRGKNKKVNAKACRGGEWAPRGNVATK